MVEGNLGVTDGYQEFLEQLLSAREQLSPVEQYKKFELVGGDVRTSLPSYLNRIPRNFSLVHLDLNLYEPTKSVLEHIKPRLFSGSIVIIDEINLRTILGDDCSSRGV